MDKLGEIIKKYKYVCQDCIIGREISEECYDWKIEGKNVCELKKLQQEILKLIDDIIPNVDTLRMITKENDCKYDLRDRIIEEIRKRIKGGMNDGHKN